MVLYLIIVSISATLIGLFNGFFNLSAFTHGVPQLIALIIAGIIFQLLVDGAFALLGRLLPDGTFSQKHSIYKVPNFERKFYELIKIRKWKDKVLELGGLSGFKKNKIADPKNPDYLKIFIIESNRGIFIHFVSIFAGFLLLVVFPNSFILCISLPIAVVNALLNVLPVFVLRYNVPKLQVAYERARKKFALETEEDEDTVIA